jgi:hypothetical protein
MVGTEGFLKNGKRSLVERLGVGVTAFVVVKRRKIVQ